MSPLGIGKLGNEYASLTRLDAPKAVWMALAVALAAKCNGGALAEVDLYLREEWEALHLNGIVPQKPPRPAPANAIEAYDRRRTARGEA